MGTKIAEWIADNPSMVIKNDGRPTHRQKGTGSPSSPDVSITSDDLDSDWSISDPIGSSDHVTIEICLEVKPAILKIPKRPYRMNTSKTDWPKFEEVFSSNIEQVAGKPKYHHLQSAILAAAEAATPITPQCRRPPRSWFDDECKAAVKKKNILAREAANNVEKLPEYVAACRDSDALASKKKEAAWQTKASKFDINTKPSEVYSTIRAIEGRATKRSMLEGIVLPSGKVVHGKQKANAYAKEYVSWAAQTPQAKKSSRSTKRSNRKRIKSKMAVEDKPPLFSNLELESALRSMHTGRAPGPDGILVEQLQHLPRVGKDLLRNELSRYILSGQTPTSWKVSTVVPILKPGKEASKLNSYRPVSLTSVVAKLAERLVLNRIQPLINRLISTEQLGFRPHRSCEDAVAFACQDIFEGLESKCRKRTAMTCLDFRKAFDSVPHALLIERLLDCEVPAYITRWIKSFLEDRRIQVRFEGLSKPKKVANGLPQGSVLSPVLFTLFLDAALDRIKSFPDVKVMAYADDVTIWAQDRNPVIAANTLQPAISDGLEPFCSNTGMKLAPEKCTYTVFSLDSRETNAEVCLKVNGLEMTKANEPTLLGVTLDRTLSFNTHIRKLCADLNRRIAAVGAVSGRTWGQRENTLRTLFKAIVQSKASFGAGVWGTFASDTSLSLVQRCLNRGARIITGCCRSTPIGPLISEAEIPTIQCLVNIKAASQIERAIRTSDHILAPFTTPVNHVRRLKRKTCFRDRGLEVVNHSLKNAPREHFPDLPDPIEMPVSIPEVTFHEVAVPKTLPMQTRKTLALEDLDKLAQPDLSLWTDGSAVEGTRNGGSGGVLIQSDGTTKEFATPAGRFCSSTRAELVALQHGLRMVNESSWSGDVLRICCDSSSAIEIVKRGALRANCVVSREIWRCLLAIGGCVQIVHVPAHVGIEENEQADFHAARGSRMRQSARKIDYATAKTAIRSHVSEDTKRQLKSAAVRKSASAKQYFELVKPKRINAATRELERNIRRLRTGHSTLLATYRKRIGIGHSDICEDCHRATDTLTHFLIDCPQLEQVRRTTLGDNVDLKAALNETELLGNFLMGSGRLSASF